jgi:hypothetical protein
MGIGVHHTPDLIEQRTYIFLLFVNMADLEPDIGMGEGTGRVPENAVEAGERLFVFALLFVDYAKAEKNLICLVEI